MAASAGVAIDATSLPLPPFETMEAPARLDGGRLIDAHRKDIKADIAFASRLKPWLSLIAASAGQEDGLANPAPPGEPPPFPHPRGRGFCGGPQTLRALTHSFASPVTNHRHSWPSRRDWRSSMEQGSTSL